MEKYEQAIAELKAMNLRNSTDEEIIQRLTLISSIGFIKLDLPVGMTIMRGRPDEGPFSKRGDLSCKPQAFNTTYQRASTPHNTMFYGAIVTKEEMQNKPSGYPRILAALESSRLLRENSKGIEPMHYSLWRISRPLSVLTIVPHADQHSRNPNTEQLRSLLKEFANSPTVDNQHTISVTDFLADTFLKRVESTAHHTEYKLSAVIAEFFIGQAKGEIDGIYYRSVRDEGGYVVALTPVGVDSGLKLQAVGKCRIYKGESEVIIDNEMVCQVEDDSKPFLMQKIDDNLRRRKEDIEKIGYTRFELA